MVTAQELYGRGTTAETVAITRSNEQAQQIAEQQAEREWLASPEGQRYTTQQAEIKRIANLPEQLQSQGYTKEQKDGYTIFSAPQAEIRTRDESRSYSPKVYTFKDGQLVSEKEYSGSVYKGGTQVNIKMERDYTSPLEYTEKKYDVVGYSSKLAYERNISDGQVIKEDTWDNSKFSKAGIVDPDTNRWVAVGTDRYKQLTQPRQQLVKNDEPITVLIGGKEIKVSADLYNKKIKGVTSIRSAPETSPSSTKSSIIGQKAVSGLTPKGYTVLQEGNITPIDWVAAGVKPNLNIGVLKEAQSKDKGYDAFIGGIVKSLETRETAAGRVRRTSEGQPGAESMLYGAAATVLKPISSKQNAINLGKSAALGLGFAALGAIPIIGSAIDVGLVSYFTYKTAKEVPVLQEAIQTSALTGQKRYALSEQGANVAAMVAGGAAFRSLINIGRSTIKASQRFITDIEYRDQLKNLAGQLVVKENLPPALQNKEVSTLIRVEPYQEYKGMSKIVDVGSSAIRKDIVLLKKGEPMYINPNEVPSYKYVAIQGKQIGTQASVINPQLTSQGRYIYDNTMPAVRVRPQTNKPITRDFYTIIPTKQFNKLLTSRKVISTIKGTTSTPSSYLESQKTPEGILILRQTTIPKTREVESNIQFITIGSISPLEIPAQGSMFPAVRGTRPKGSRVPDVAQTGIAKTSPTRDILTNKEKPLLMGKVVSDLIPYQTSTEVGLGRAIYIYAKPEPIITYESFSVKRLVPKIKKIFTANDILPKQKTISGTAVFGSTGAATILRTETVQAKKTKQQQVSATQTVQAKKTKQQQVSATQTVQSRSEYAYGGSKYAQANQAYLVSESLSSVSPAQALASRTATRQGMRSGYKNLMASLYSFKSMQSSGSLSAQASLFGSLSAQANAQILAKASASAQDSLFGSLSAKASAQESLQDSLLRQDLILRQITNTREEIKKEPPEKPPKKLKFSFGAPTEITRGEEARQQAYEVLIKRTQAKLAKGKYQSRGYVKANTQPLTKAAALGLGASIVDTYANRSFTIRKVKGMPQSNLEYEARARALLYRYRQAKKNRNVYVEKEKFAISSQQEKEAIPYEAQRQRRVVSYSFLASKGRVKSQNRASKMGLKWL